VDSRVLITEPKDGDTIERQIVVKGTLENVPEDMDVWVYVETDENRYYPKRARNDPDRINGWIVDDIRVGEEGQGDTGKRFSLGVFLAKRQDTTYLQGVVEYGAELGPAGEFPERFQVLHNVNVCRDIPCR